MKEILSSKYLDLGLDSINRGIKDGIEIDKGTILNEEYLTKNFDDIGKLIELFSVYPDLYLDIITPEDSNFELFFYQRIVLRAVMRFKNIFITAPRAFSKSFIIILGMMLQDIFIPGHKNFICAPQKNQSAQIAKEKITEIYDRWPLIRKEVIGGEVSDTPGNFGKDYVKLLLTYASVMR